MRKRAYYDGNYGKYWTRSPDVRYSTYVHLVIESGSIYGFTYPNNKLGVLIEISF